MTTPNPPISELAPKVREKFPDDMPQVVGILIATTFYTCQVMSEWLTSIGKSVDEIFALIRTDKKIKAEQNICGILRGAGVTDDLEILRFIREHIKDVSPKFIRSFVWEHLADPAASLYREGWSYEFIFPKRFIRPKDSFEYTPYLDDEPHNNMSKGRVPRMDWQKYVAYLTEQVKEVMDECRQIGIVPRDAARILKHVGFHGEEIRYCQKHMLNPEERLEVMLCYWGYNLADLLSFFSERPSQMSEKDVRTFIKAYMRSPYEKKEVIYTDLLHAGLEVTTIARRGVMANPTLLQVAHQHGVANESLAEAMKVMGYNAVRMTKTFVDLGVDLEDVLDLI